MVFTGTCRFSLFLLILCHGYFTVLSWSNRGLGEDWLAANKITCRYAKSRDIQIVFIFIVFTKPQKTIVIPHFSANLIFIFCFVLGLLRAFPTLFQALFHRPNPCLPWPCHRTPTCTFFHRSTRRNVPEDFQRNAFYLHCNSADFPVY